MVVPEMNSASKGFLLTSGGGLEVDKVHVRADGSYTDKSQKFIQQAKDFTKQYAHIYAVRLVRTRDALTKRIHEKWGVDIPVKKLIDLNEEDNEQCVIIGTLFKHQELKPSILKEISEEHQLAPQPPRKNFVDEEDQLILEDEQERIRLIGKLNVHSVVTGVVCAVLGKDTGDGKFEVVDYCWPNVLPRVREPLFIVLVSGLGLANNADALLPLQLLTDWISGLLGDPEEQRNQAQAVRLIIAGNSVRDCAPHKVSAITNAFKIDVEDTLNATRHLDDFLHQLVSFIDVDVMPGEHDPANHMLPQQPLHFCMFPKANTFETLHCKTNPYECEVANCRVLGTSGQPVNDVAAYSKVEDPLTILQQTLEWGHIAPTCPDTLSGFPYYDEDPFIITECPDVYFAGNQPAFQTKLYEGPEGQRTRLVCIPSFAKTHSCVVVELNSLDCYPVSFGAGDFADSEM
ncbi:DNA polymerase delta small subunit [Gryllus bimaculatus]|nr:DNA polymerase delta small subunit [Gryllus bimaculatus]